jgi:PPOX class probable F420-dependent enzyme
MSSLIPDSHKDLLVGAVVVSLATINPDGGPQVTPVWVDYDGEHVLVNTARGRQKDHNMTERPLVTVLAVDPTNPYRWMEIRGKVVEQTEDGAVAFMDRMAKLYFGRDKYYAGPNAGNEGKETRVLYKIQPQKVIAR